MGRLRSLRTRAMNRPRATINTPGRRATVAVRVGRACAPETTGLPWYSSRPAAEVPGQSNAPAAIPPATKHARILCWLIFSCLSLVQTDRRLRCLDTFALQRECHDGKPRYNDALVPQAALLPASRPATCPNRRTNCASTRSTRPIEVSTANSADFAGPAGMPAKHGRVRCPILSLCQILVFRGPGIP